MTIRNFRSILWKNSKNLFLKFFSSILGAKMCFLACFWHFSAPKVRITIPGPMASCSSSNFSLINNFSMLFNNYKTNAPFKADSAHCVAFRFFLISKVAGLKFDSDSSKSSNLTVFGHFQVVKRQVDYFVCAILVVLLETNRLVPWLRQSDHSIKKYHAPRAPRDRHIIMDFQIF